MAASNWHSLLIPQLLISIVLFISTQVAAADIAGMEVLGQDNHTSYDPNDWPSYNHDNLGHRYNRAEHVLNKVSIKDLQVKWKYPTCLPVHSTPVVVDDTLFAGDMCGIVYALSRDGELIWKTQLGRFILGSAGVNRDLVIIGDMAGFIYGLDRKDGSTQWSIRPNPHPFAAIWGSPIIAENRVIVGVASLESSAPAVNPLYPCCSFRGSLVALDPETGELLWQHYFISEAESAEGASGAGVWSIPSYDNASGLVFVGTGNNLSAPSSSASNAVVAVNIETGERVWHTQFTSGEFWNHSYLYDEEHQDADVGDSPKLYKIGGRSVVGAGDKTGTYYVLDAASGEILHEEELLPPGLLGGFQTGMAYAKDMIFTNGVNWPDAQSPMRLPAEQIPPSTAGHVLALNKEGKELWRFTTEHSINASGVAVAADVVYFQSMQNGYFYALDADSGELLKKIDIGAALSGPSVSRGQIYLGTGNVLYSQILPFDPNGEIIALGLE